MLIYSFFSLCFFFLEIMSYEYMPLCSINIGYCSSEIYATFFVICKNLSSLIDGNNDMKIPISGWKKYELAWSLIVPKLSTVMVRISFTANPGSVTPDYHEELRLTDWLTQWIKFHCTKNMHENIEVKCICIIDIESVKGVHAIASRKELLSRLHSVKPS